MSDKLPTCKHCRSRMMFKLNKHHADPFVYCSSLKCRLNGIGTKLSETKGWKV